MEGGGTERQHLEVAAAKGIREAIRALDGPECPESLAYLQGWIYELFGRSGEGMNGAARLTYATIVHWAALLDRTPSIADVEALLLLDAVMMHPDVGDD